MPRLSCSSPVSISVTGDTGIGERHRDAAAHGAGADDGDALDIARFRAFRNTGDLGRLALGEERVTLRLRLVAWIPA